MSPILVLFFFKMGDKNTQLDSQETVWDNLSFHLWISYRPTDRFHQF